MAKNRWIQDQVMEEVRRFYVCVLFQLRAGSNWDTLDAGGVGRFKISLIGRIRCDMKRLMRSGVPLK